MPFTAAEINAYLITGSGRSSLEQAFNNDFNNINNGGIRISSFVAIFTNSNSSLDPYLILVSYRNNQGTTMLGGVFTYTDTGASNIWEGTFTYRPDLSYGNYIENFTMIWSAPPPPPPTPTPVPVVPTPTPVPVVPAPVGYICFSGETVVTTDQGDIQIKDIEPDFHTINHKRIVAITKTISTDDELVCIPKNSYYNENDITVTKNHLVFYQFELIPACKIPNVRFIPYQGELLYNILMEEYDCVLIDNIYFETLHPDNVIAKLYLELKEADVETQRELIMIHNQLILSH
jgi:hypothetical protein